jgi:glycosyltransferase involved in cell wall biosynthesis
LARLQNWDKTTANRVNEYIAISETVATRIHECYARTAHVIYPPVDTDFYRPASTPREDFYLVVSALAPYKRVDLAISACQRLKRKLVVIGTGQVERQLRASSGNNVQWLGWQSDETIRSYMQRCRALIFPGEEDFGIVPVEAQACASPVIAFGRGGATETVNGLDSAAPTGEFFTIQSTDALIEAILAFERRIDEIDPANCRTHAQRFSNDRFDDNVRTYFQNAAKIQPRAIHRAA